MSLVDMLSDEGERLARVDRINGVVVGVIASNEDEEGLGRVKVSLPWLGEESETGWAKVATLMAGPERGTFFLPEVGDEGLVAFEQGNINHPYVIGSLFNASDAPPETNGDGKNNVRTIRSRSGHELTFVDDDESQAEQVRIRSNAGHSVVLDDTSGSEKIEITDKTGSNTITIDSNSNEISIESSATIKIESQQIQIRAGASMKLESGGMLEIKGALVKIN